MGTAAKPIRENRTITVDFRDEATYFQLLGDGKAFLECVLAFLMALGFQLKHKATCDGGGCFTRHSHYVRVRLGGVTIWRVQCTRCKAVFTVLPHWEHSLFFKARNRPCMLGVRWQFLLNTLGMGGPDDGFCSNPFARNVSRCTPAHRGAAVLA